MAAWENLLPQDDPFRDFLLDGINNGFRITDNAYNGPPVWQDNYKSATDPQHRQLVEKQIHLEIQNGRYLPVSSKPSLISALGAIPKQDSHQVRLIHDCSRPQGGALNDFAVNDPFSYQSVQDAVSFIKPSSYLAKVDLASAYRSVKIHPDDWKLAGLAWTFSGEVNPTVLIDSRLMFGAKKSPYVFHQLSQAVCRIMAYHGFPNVICYLDDFLVIGDSKTDCQAAFTYLLKLLRTLGFSINYGKLVGPTKVLTFLGIELNVNLMILRLPEEKLGKFLQEVNCMYNAKNASKRQLQSLVGRLSWACQAIQGGRPYIRRLLDRINTLKGPGHRTRITMEIKRDLAWWITFSRTFNGSVPMLDLRNHLSVSLDACSYGAGGFFGNQFYHLPWEAWEGTSDLHINFKEVLALEPALTLWGHQWANHRVHVHSDNQTAVAIINRGTSRDPRVMQALRRIFWLSATYNISLVAHYYPGHANVLADACSRLPHPTAWATLASAAPIVTSTDGTAVSHHSQERGFTFSVPLLGPQYEIFLCNAQEILSRILHNAWPGASTSLHRHSMLLCSIPGTQTKTFINKAVHEYHPHTALRMGITQPTAGKSCTTDHTKRYPETTWGLSVSTGSSHSSDVTPFPKSTRPNQPGACGLMGCSSPDVFWPATQEQCAAPEPRFIRPPPPSSAQGHRGDRPRHSPGDPLVQDQPIPCPNYEFAFATDSRPPPLPITGHFHGNPTVSSGPPGRPCLGVPVNGAMAAPHLANVSGSLQGSSTRHL